MTDVQPTISSLTTWADEIRTRELARVESKLADLSHEDRRLVERITTRIVREFLRRPIEQLEDLAVTPSGPEYAGLVAYLFDVGEAAR
jgi:glutamyl-tRNA reductase